MSNSKLVRCSNCKTIFRVDYYGDVKCPKCGAAGDLTHTPKEPSANLRVAISYLIAIAIAEAFTASFRANNLDSTKYLYLGLILHAFILVMLIGHSSMSKSKDISNVLLAMAMAPLIRMISLTMPLYRFAYPGWFLILSIPLLIAPLAIAYVQGIPGKALGLTLGKKPILQILTILFGLGFGAFEYMVLKPALMIPAEVTVYTVTAAVLLLALATGFSEEFIFRGIIQNSTINAFGTKAGVLFTSILFAILHIGNITGWNFTILDIPLVFMVGFVYSIVMLKTRSIIGISISHTLTNVTLFIICPIVFPMLGWA
jgi:membrane protease YdiL (CAAX protease family)/phage FluMu protein Com